MRSGRNAGRRAVAALLLSAFAAFLAAPLVHADESEGNYCGGDRCCCAPDLSEGQSCFRSVCRCGTEAREAVVVSLGEMVLPASPQIPRAGVAPFRALAPSDLPPSPPLAPPFHPPPAP